MNNTTISILMILFASFMWGSWGQFIKRIEGWSLRGFMFVLYSASIILTWTALFCSGGTEAYKDLFYILSLNRELLFYPIAGGIIYTFGMWFNIVAINLAGLTITNIVFSSTAILLGTALSVFGGGLPGGTSMIGMIFGTIFILIAVYLSSMSVKLRQRAETNLSDGKSIFKTVLFYGALSGTLVASFPFFMTLSIKTHIRETGLNSFQYMALLSVGSFITAIIVCLIPLIKSKKVKKTFVGIPVIYYIFAILSGIAHYGGNIINAYFAPYIGMAISWPIGQTMAMWGIFWGFVYHEYKNAPKSSLLCAYMSIFSIIVGIIIFSLLVYV